MAEPTPVPQVCRNCVYWRSPLHLLLLEREFSAEAMAASGVCRRFPQTVIKDPTAWCGEHRHAVSSEEEKE